MSARESDIYLTNEQFLAVLKHQRERIAKGIPLWLTDDDTPGAKTTEASWGTCSESRELWTRETVLFPDEFPRRVAPKYTTPEQACPFDRRGPHPGDLNGCFFTCRLFKPSRHQHRPGREEALRLYDIRIRQMDP